VGGDNEIILAIWKLSSAKPAFGLGSEKNVYLGAIGVLRAVQTTHVLLLCTHTDFIAARAANNAEK
jgi:hypothetical protein